MSAIENLKRDHRAIEQALAVLSAATNQLEADRHVDPQVFRGMRDFIVNFADKSHHSKEEQTLFPFLELRGIPKPGPLDVMLSEHQEGRRLVRELGQAIEGYDRGDPAARQRLIRTARGYQTLITDHISKEENVLFQWAEQVLSPEDHGDLLGKFEEIEGAAFRERKRQEYLDELEKLAGALSSEV